MTDLVEPRLVKERNFDITFLSITAVTEQVLLKRCKNWVPVPSWFLLETLFSLSKSIFYQQGLVRKIPYLFFSVLKIQNFLKKKKKGKTMALSSSCLILGYLLFLCSIRNHRSIIIKAKLFCDAEMTEISREFWFDAKSFVRVTGCS